MSTDQPSAQNERRDWSYACTGCSWTGWTPAEINACGEHLNPDGGTCSSAIDASPPPTRAAAT